MSAKINLFIFISHSSSSRNGIECYTYNIIIYLISFFGCSHFEILPDPSRALHEDEGRSGPNHYTHTK